MSSNRFPNAEEIQELRALGTFSNSKTSCRVLASLIAVGYLIKSNFQQEIKSLLDIANFDGLIVSSRLLSILQISIVVIVIYSASYLILFLLQSRFYFNLGRAFSRKDSVISLSRGLKLLTLKALISSLGALSILILLVVGLKRYFVNQLLVISYSSSNQILNSIKANMEVMAWVILSLSVFVGLVTFVYSKISFMIQNRVVVKRG